ncbi:FecR domain-containing protein [Ekhidna sp. MALMAid0563]|uniref:FecR family protein n=1 Tax=Ekhidna sp. MALMAid0563 TaxID=3143937 RepID=UPI0032DF7EC9
MKENAENHNEIIELASRKFAGEATDQEESRLSALLDESEANKQYYAELVKVWDGTEKVAGITPTEINEEWIRLRGEIRKSQKKSFSFMKIAASIALLTAIGVSFFLLKGDNTENLVAEQIQEQTLEDGSIVTLNADSELRYPKNFSNEASREVRLKGEAYFEVEKNPEKPFVIKTPTVEVQVLGTSFSVRSREGESTSSVVVSSGSVAVKYGGNRLELKPNEKAILDRSSGRLFKVTNDDPNYLSWKTKQFVFDDTSLEKVVANLSSAYQVNIQLMSENMSECPVTVSFDNQSLDTILEVLKATLDLSVEKTSEGFEISGQGC